MHPHDLFVEAGRGRVDTAIRAIFEGNVSNLEARVQARDGKVTRYQVTSHQIEIDGVPCVLGQGVELAPESLQVDALPAAMGTTPPT